MFYKVLISLLFLTQVSLAQPVIEPCHFGQPLIDALQDSYTPSSPLGYNNGRDILYSQIDNNGLELSGIYTNFTVTLDPNTDPSVSAFQNGNGLNAEHVYPQSKGAANEPAKSDLHNIFPSKVDVNSSRGSCPFDEVEDTDTDFWFYLAIQTNNIPSTEIENYSEKDEEDCVFEPRESVKGNIARAVFYFYTIYQNQANSADPNFFAPQKDILLQWHLEDPADEKEKKRDSLIAMQQGNRNPFILDSTLVVRAFFTPDASFPSDDPNCFTTSISELDLKDWVSISSNLIYEEVIVFSEKQNGNVLLFNLQGQLIQEKTLDNETRLSMENLPQGVYILQVQSEGLRKVFKIFKK